MTKNPCYFRRSHPFTYKRDNAKSSMVPAIETMSAMRLRKDLNYWQCYAGGLIKG